MAFVHGKNTYVSLNGTDISAFTRSTTYNTEADTHDVTCYGKTRKVYVGGLVDATVTLEGWYQGTSGARTVVKPLVGTNVTWVFRPEGTGSGKPQDTADVVVSSYNESSPVDNVIQWTCELQLSDTIAVTGQ